MSNVIHLHKPPQKIAHYLRVGFQEHVLADRMRTEGRLSQFGVVFDACNVLVQKELMREVARDGHELILDTNVAEQSVPGRFSGIVSSAPWAKVDAPLTPDDCRPVSNSGGIIEPIVRFAVENGFHSILSPTHYLGGDQSHWLDVDLRNCEALRVSLDHEGGGAIRIYHELIMSNAQLKDASFIADVTDRLRGLPIDALWLRVSGFGGDATGEGVDKAARAIVRLHELGVPVIMDRLGGLPAYALASFGVVSGYANGMKGRDRFSTSGWLKPASSGGGGNETSVFISGLDRRLTRSELASLFASSTTARSVYGCRNPSCCRSVDAMLREPEAHNLTEQKTAVATLSVVPELLRPEHFLDKHLGAARKKADRSQKLKNASDSFRKLGGEAATRLARMEKALEKRVEHLGKIDFAPEATLPSGIAPQSTVSIRRGRP